MFMKRALSVFLSFLMIISTICAVPFSSFAATSTAYFGASQNANVWNGSIATSFDSGSGTQSNPYVIKTGAQLAYLAQSTNAGNTYSGKYFVLANDINLSGKEWTPIGKGILTSDTGVDSVSFKGNFDGQYHIIDNLTIKNNQTTNNGLFGLLWNSVIQNIGVTNVDISISTTSSNRINCGGIIGTCYETTVSKCFVTGKIEAHSATISKAGGIIGITQRNSHISDCWSQINAISGNGPGGICGGLYNASNGVVIERCYSNSTLTRSGTSNGNTQSGGIAAYADSGTIKNCVFIGTLYDKTENGIAESRATITNCYHASNASNGTKISADSFKSQSWIVSNLGWDFDTVWEFGTKSDYPVLRGFSQAASGTVITPEPSVADVWNGSVATSFESGSGTESNPYVIKTGAQLAYLAQSTNSGNTYSGKYFVLENDINLSGREWTPIGKGSDTSGSDYSTLSFSGVFDGNHHTISNLKINNTVLKRAGLFGALNNATVKSLGITEADIKISQNNIISGGVIGGTLSNTTVSECFASGAVYVVDNDNTNSHCANAGMIAGRTDGTINITNCFAVGNVYGTMPYTWNAYVGGLFGAHNTGAFEMKNCYFNGQVKSSGASSSYAGGLVGIPGSNNTKISNSFVVGEVIAETGSLYAGNIISKWSSYAYDVTNCYYNISISGQSENNGTYTTLSNLKSQSWIASNLGWNFNTVWEFGTKSDYPVLRGFSQATSGTVITPEPSVADVWNGSVATSFESGSGTESNPYVIKTAAQLAYLAQSTNAGNTYSGKYFVLANDIDLASRNWTPIGKGVLTSDVTTTSNTFRGHFNGNNHRILNLKITSAISSFTGLFGMSYNAEINNLGIENAVLDLGSLSDSSYRLTAAALSGSTLSTTISNCYVTGNVKVNCSSFVDIGLVVGDFYSTTLSNCYAIGDVNVTSTYNGCVGGGFGYSSGSTVNNFLYKGSCTSSVAAKNAVIGAQGSSTFNRVYYCSSTSDSNATSLTESKLKVSSNFSGWDFTNTWEIVNGEYPTLRSFGNSGGTHSHSYISSIIKSATCTENGTRQYTCSSCGASYTVTIPATGHTEGDWITDRAATCTAAGSKHKACTVCGATLRTQSISALGHSRDNGTIIKNATCTQNGTIRYSCSRCSYSYTESIPALGHDVIERTSADGRFLYKYCSRGMYFEEREVTLPSDTYPQSAHNYSNNFAKTYQFSYSGAKKLILNFSSSTETESDYDFIYIYGSTGNLIGTYSGSELSSRSTTIDGDSFSIRLTSDSSVTYYGFSFSSIVAVTDVAVNNGDCDYSETVELYHNYAETVVQATCTANGYKKYQCDYCGDEYYLSIPAIGHNYISSIKNPTCTDKGYTSYKCSRCGDSYNSNYKNALGHNTIRSITQATLSTNGKIVVSCKRCGKKESETVIYRINTVKLSGTDFVHDGKAKTPDVIVKDSKGNTLKKGTDYSVSYSNNKAIGAAKARITFKGNYKGTVIKSFIIRPEPTTLTSLLSPAKNTIVINWKQISNLSGYEVQVSLGKNFKKNDTVTYTAKKTSKKATLSGMVPKNTYYFRIRTFKTVSGKTYYSSWSKSKSVKCK